MLELCGLDINTSTLRFNWDKAYYDVSYSYISKSLNLILKI